MAIDQRDVSSTLRFMDDRALQQYAAMHKNDPYIFPLAFQESQNRQRLRMQQQTAQAMQPQPKVTEQALAQMSAQPMPEEQGIGALPAGNMQQMADGGIAGYDDAADFVSRSEPVVMMAEGGVARYQGNPRDGSLVRMPYGGDTMGMPDPTQEALNALQAEEAGATRARTRKIAELEQQVAFLTAAGAPQAATVKAQLDALKAPAPFKGTMPEAGYTYKGMENDPRLNTPPSKPVGAAPKVDTGRRDTERKTPAPAAAPAARPTKASGATPAAGLGDLSELYQGILNKQNYKDPAAAELTKLEEAERTAATEAKTALERDQAKFAEAFKGREQRLSSRELDITKQKDTNTGLALLNAGLAIMSTPGSLATAIGKGAQVGTAQFAAGLDKIRSAQERLDEARDKMEDLKLNRAEMSAKEIRAAEADIRNVAVNAQKRAIDGIRTAADVNRKTAGDMFKAAVDVGVNRERIASAEGIAAMQERGQNARAGRNQQLELLQAVQADPKLAAAYRSMYGKGEDVMGQYNDFLKANPTLALDPKAAFTQFLMTKSAFAQLGAPTVTDKAAGPVRKQP